MISGSSLPSLTTRFGLGIVPTIVRYVLPYVLFKFAEAYVASKLSDPLTYAALSLILLFGYLLYLFFDGVLGLTPRTAGEARAALCHYGNLGVLLGCVGGSWRLAAGMETARSLVTTVIISDWWFVFLWLCVMVPLPLKFIDSANQHQLLRCAGLCVVLFVCWVTQNVVMAFPVGFLNLFAVSVPAMSAVLAYEVSLSDVFSVVYTGEEAIPSFDAFRLIKKGAVSARGSFIRVGTGRSTCHVFYQGKKAGLRSLVWAIASAIVLVYLVRWLAFDPCSDVVRERASVKELFRCGSPEFVYIDFHGRLCGWPRVTLDCLKSIPTEAFGSLWE